MKDKDTLRYLESQIVIFMRTCRIKKVRDIVYKWTKTDFDNVLI